MIQLLVSLFYLALELVMVLVRLVRDRLTPWQPAAPFIERLNLVRLVSAWASLVTLGVVWKWQVVEAWDGWDFDAAAVNFLVAGPIYVAGSLIVGSLIMVVAARRGVRRQVLLNVRRPLVTMFSAFTLVGLTYVGLIGLAWALDATTSAVSDAPTMTLTLVFGFLSVVMIIGAFVASLAGMVCIPTAAYYISKEFFAARNGHPQLRPLVVIIFTVSTTAVGWRQHLTELSAYYPSPVVLLALICGPAVSLIIAVIEMSWLHRREGIAFRLPVTWTRVD